VTFKGKTEPGKHKTRPQYETEVTDPATMAKILECSGFRPVFRYEKYRTEFDRDTATLEMLGRLSNRSRPFEAQIAVAGPDRIARDRHGIDPRSV